MKIRHGKSSWIAFVLFYLVLLSIISILDVVNGVLTMAYLAVQVGLVSLGVGIFALIGLLLPDLSATRGVLLAFTIGVLTIIPAVLMGLGQIPNLWPQYFLVAFGMATGSFLTFLFLKLFGKKATLKDQSEWEVDQFDRGR